MNNKMSLVPKYIEYLEPYVPGKRIEEIKQKYNLDNIIKLSSNENPLGPSTKAIERVKHCLKNTHRYPDSSGYLLRNTLAIKYKLKINNVIIGNGSEGIMSAIIRTFLHEDDELIGSEDSFIGFKVLANSSGRKIHWVKMNNYYNDLEAMVNIINKKTKIIYLANPDNPTGTYFTKNQFNKFIKRVPKRVVVILDEAYYEYAENQSDYPDSLIYRYDNVITLRTFSKCYGLAGFRVGYGFAHEKLITNLLKVKLPFEPSIPAQEAALGALEDNEHLQNTLKTNTLGLKLIIDEFKKLHLNYIPTVTNFITLIFKNDKKAKNFIQNMLNNGIILRRLKSFGLPSCVRISIGNNKENKYFIKILNKLVKC